MKKLRPIEISIFKNGIVERCVKGRFHQWTDTHKRVDQISMGGPAAIVETDDGVIHSFMLDEDNIEIKFLDNLLQQAVETLREGTDTQ